jgi:hypothetical protein
METMQWILPVTVIPGIGLIIMSTSSLLISLNKEIAGLNQDRERYIEVIELKIRQLKRLNWSLVLLYIGILLFLAAGITGAISHPENFIIHLSMILGIIVLILAILLLIIYGFKSIYIREKHLRI